MADAKGGGTDQPAYKGAKAPCVYCGKVIERGVDRCPHCRISYSFAVRKASREVVGEWFYLDPRNPSGRGVTFETLIKMIEKGRIKPDSIVRGPTTHHDWMFAAEAPRLAKYLRLCPHCFAEARPEDTYCDACQMNMNERPAEARPDAAPDAVKEPFHKAAYQMEERLAEAAGAEPTETPPPAPAVGRPVPSSEPSPRPGPPRSPAAAAAAALADSAADPGERRSRVGPTPERARPKLWLVLVLTWVTLIPIFLVLAYAVPDFPLHTTLHSAFGRGETAPPETPPQPTGEVDPQWLQAQLARADAAEQKKDYAAAMHIYEEIVEKTGEESWRQRIAAIRHKSEQERRKRLQKLRDRLEMAEDLAARKRYDDALAVLRNISPEDRRLLGSLGIGVENMEGSIRTAKAQHDKKEQQRKELTERLAAAKALRQEGRPKEALAAYEAIGNAFDADLVADFIDLANVIRALKAEIAKAEAAEPPEPPPDEAATEIADLLAKTASLEKAEKFSEALATLQQIKETFDKKFWPDQLEQRIRDVKSKKEALEFFGMD